MFRRLCASVLTGVVLLVSITGAGAAQTSRQAVPTACMVEPVGILEVLGVLNNVEEAQFQPSVTSVPISAVLPGTSISPQDLDAITDTTTQLVGCANSLQVFGALALLIERFQARLVVEVMEGNGMDELVEQMPILAEQTAQTQGVQAIPIQEAWYADAGNRTIMAVLTPVAADPAQQHSFLVTYVYSIDHWLIDNVQPITTS